MKLFYSHARAAKAGAKVKKGLVFLQKKYEVWLDKKQMTRVTILMIPLQQVEPEYMSKGEKTQNFSL